MRFSNPITIVNPEDLPKIAGPWEIIEREGFVQYIIRYRVNSSIELAKVSPTAAGKWTWVVRGTTSSIINSHPNVSASGYLTTKEDCVTAADAHLKKMGFKILDNLKLINFI